MKKTVMFCIFFISVSLIHSEDIDLINVGLGLEASNYNPRFTSEINWMHFFKKTEIGLGHHFKFTPALTSNDFDECIFSQSINLTLVYMNFSNKNGSNAFAATAIPNFKYGALYSEKDNWQLYTELHWFYIFFTGYVGYLPFKNTLRAGFLFSIPVNKDFWVRQI